MLTVFPFAGSFGTRHSPFISISSETVDWWQILSRVGGIICFYSGENLDDGREWYLPFVHYHILRDAITVFPLARGVGTAVRTRISAPVSFSPVAIGWREKTFAD